MFPRNSFGIPWKHLTVLTDAFDLKLLHSLNHKLLTFCFKSRFGTNEMTLYPSLVLVHNLVQH